MFNWLASRRARVLRTIVASVIVAGGALGAGVPRSDAQANSLTLEAVQGRGILRCGVHRGGVGLAEVNANGYWTGYFVELCRIVAAATIGDAEAVRFVEVDDISASLALTEDLADVVISTLDPGGPGALTPARVDDGIAYLTPVLEDRLMLVPSRGAIRRVSDLPQGARICSGGHAAYRRSLEQALGGRMADVEVASYDSIDGLFNAFHRQRCDAIGYHSFVIRSQGILRAPSQTRLQLSGIDLGRVVFRPSVMTGDVEWRALVDSILRFALFVPVGDDSSASGPLSAGSVRRIREIAAAPDVVFERTLGHDGGQGFDPATPASGT